MTGILTPALTSGGTLLGACIGAAAGYLGARRGAKAGLEAGRADRLWANRAEVYEQVAAWVRTRREINDQRCPACFRGEHVDLEPLSARQVFPGAGQLAIWASQEVLDLYYTFAWWDDWIHALIGAIQDPEREGRHIVASEDKLLETYEDAIRTGQQLIERIRAELAGTATGRNQPSPWGGGPE